MLPPGCEPRCRGCAHRLLSEAQSRERKLGWLRERLEPWSGLLGEVVSPANRWDYRDRVRLTARHQDGSWRFGTMARDELVPIPDCPVHTPRVRKAVHQLTRALPPDLPLAFYVQVSAQATLVLRAREAPVLRLEPEPLQEAGLETLWLHLHPAAGKRMFSDHGWVRLWGPELSRDEEGHFYGPTAFQQATPELHRLALQQVEEFLAPRADDQVVDLYSGPGKTLHRWLKRRARTIGVELAGEAVRCARLNAPGADILRGKCRHRLPQLQAWLKPEGRRLLFANPPRTGLESEVLDWILKSLRPERVAYLSCSAGTLRRDLDAFEAHQYKVAHLRAFDFFPQTRHVETLAMLSR